MSSYINQIENEIERQISKNNDLSIIRLEGFDSPLIYKEICSYFKNTSLLNLHAKLSKEKYEEFKNEDDPLYYKSLEFLEKNDYIDLDGSMTRWRNNSTEVESQYKKTLILLMGTEVVPDKGGLADFYKISPEIILNIIKKDYSIWFKEILRENGIDEKYLKALNTLFTSLFKNVNTDLIKLSNLVDYLGELELFTIDDIIQEICMRLDKDWGIPSISTEKKAPKANNLLKGKLKSAEIIDKSFKFITRIQFKKGTTKSAYSKLIQKIDKYAEEKNIDREDKFPLDTQIFNNYEEFKENLLDFIEGKNYLELRDKFIKIDFSLIDDILNLKLPTEPTTPKDKTNKIFGEPIEAYITMISESILEYKKEYRELPESLEIRVSSIKLSNCSTDEEKDHLYSLICMCLGGIIEYLQINEGILAENINISYIKNLDPFNKESINNGLIDVPITKSSNINELSKITFDIRVRGEEKARKKEYIYCFSPVDSWIVDFIILNNSNLLDINYSTVKVPLYIKASNLSDYFKCESDEEFFMKLYKISTQVYDGEYQTIIGSELENEEINNEFGNLIYEYKKLLNIISNNGYYYTLINDNYNKRVFMRYSSLLKVARDNYDNLTSTQRESLFLLLNMFLIGEKSFNEFKSNKCNSILIPAYHPVMLEKMYYKVEYLKNSLEEVVSFINIDKVNNEKKLSKILSYNYRMCSITSGLDAYCFNGNRLITSDKIHGRYAIYAMDNSAYNLISDKSYDSNFVEDSEIDKKELIKRTHKSNIITQNIVDYLKTFPARVDGINILFVNPDDMQHIVAGVHDAVEHLKDKINTVNINIRIVVPKNRVGGSDYLKFWLDNCFEDDGNTNISTCINYIDFESSKLQNQLTKIIDFEDLTYIYKILNESEIGFVKVSNESIYEECKYPSVYTPMPISVTQETRAVDISQRQFITSNEHLQLTHKYMRPNEIESMYRVVKKLQVVEKKRELVDYIHEKSNWVVCLDETIDKNLLNTDNSKIIGFSTGQGVFGELNTTVSARSDILLDVQMKLKNKLMSKFTKWLPEIADKAANNCIDISKDLDGSKMLKALNPHDYEIHNYLAYVLTMQSIHMNNDDNRYVIRTLINLDNYMHWFDNNIGVEVNRESKLRPDFLVLEVEKNDELFDKEIPLKIKATVIECKMAKESETYIEEAKNQIIEGITVLAQNFSQLNKSVNRRYWYNQLYRALIFSKIKISDNEPGYDVLIDKISNIYEVKFEIEWNGKVYAYWIDRNDDKFTVEEIKEREDIEFNLNKLEVYTGGQLFIQKLLLPKESREIDLEFNEDIEVTQEKSQFALEVLEVNIDEFDDIFSDINENDEEEDEVYTDRRDENQDKEGTKLSSVAENNYNDNNGYEMGKDNKLSQIVSDNLEGVKEEKESDIRFLLGEDIRTKEKIYWEYKHKQLNNRHLLINGNSGSGKTYCIQTLILEATRNNISTIVFDYTDGFTRSKLSPLLLESLGDKFEERYVKYQKFPINPFKRGKDTFNGQEFDEPYVDVANRIASSFKNVYNFGPQQRNTIYSAVLEGIKMYGDNMTLSLLEEKLNEIGDNTASTVISKIKPLVDYDPFQQDSSFSWENIISKNGEMYVIQLSGFDREIQVILTDLILWDIWNYAVRNGNEEVPIPLVLDEAQNLSHGENTPSGKILAEGRKFGISGWYATQFMKGRLDSGEIGNLQQAAQKLYFSPPEESIVEVSKYIDISSDGSKMWAEKLSKLTKGYCVTTGYKAKENKIDKYEPKIIKITSLEERINI